VTVTKQGGEGRRREGRERMFVNTWQDAIASGRREKEYSGTIIPTLHDKPVLLAGLLLVYGLHQHCCVRLDEGADGFLSSQVLSMASTDTGVMLLCLVLLSIAAVADAVIEVESEVREQERLRIQ